MFNKLQKKVYNSVLLIIVLFALLISAISYCAISFNMFSSQAQRTLQNVQSGIAGCQNYFSTVMGFVKNGAKNPQIINAVQGQAGDISAQLNGLTNNSVQIDGAILYGFNGYVAYSGGVGSPPSLQQLMQIEQIGNFVLSEQESCVCVRNSVVAKAYQHSPYNQQKGIVSVINKVYSNGVAVGILVADILPQTLYDQKLSLYSFGSESYTFLQSDGLLCDNSQFAAYASSVTTNGFTQDKSYYCAVSHSQEGWSVITFVPQKVFRQRLAAILGVFVAVDVILISLGMLFASNVADSVIKPLNNVSKKMGKI